MEPILEGLALNEDCNASTIALHWLSTASPWTSIYRSPFLTFWVLSLLVSVLTLNYHLFQESKIQILLGPAVHKLQQANKFKVDLTVEKRQTPKIK